MTVEELKKVSKNAHKYMEPDLSKDASSRWLLKEVTDETIIFDGTSLEGLNYKDNLKISVDHEEALTFNSCIKMEGESFAEGVSPRPSISFSFKPPFSDFSKYNRISLWIKPVAVGYTNFYLHFGFCSNNEWVTDAPSLKVNEWNHVNLEIGGYERSNVTSLSLTLFLFGCPPEATPEVECYVDRIQLENVKEDYDYGWSLDGRIAYCHAGYYQDAKKIAVTGKVFSKDFKVYTSHNLLEFTGMVKEVTNELGTYSVMDFSNVTTPGIYHIEIEGSRTPDFEISDNPYLSSIWKSINFLRCLRCGEDIDKVHSACHLNCKCVHPVTGATVPTFGGWHDAGDVSQFEICTSEMAHAVLDLAESVKDSDQDLYDRLMEEARIGVSWTLRTRFGDGYRALAVGYSVWRDNVVKPDNTSIITSKAENGPFENFISAACLAKAAVMYKHDDPLYADWCARAAIDDFRFAYLGYKEGLHTARWGSILDAQYAGHGALAAVELHKLTSDHEYLDVAATYARIVLACQEREGIGNEGLRGFFYEAPDHKYIMLYEHRGHENSPIQGLAALYEVTDDDELKEELKTGLNLYAEYVKKTLNDTYPYGLVPGHLYFTDKINMERITVPASYGTVEENYPRLQEQVRCGRKVAENAYLRKFPIAVQRRGFHATLLAKAKAISVIGRVLKDEELIQIAIDQLEWVLGKNPFASSTMYGEGYNYHPLYVAFSPQMVGALPVGIETKGFEDIPYWPQMTQAVYKEIWGHTTGKYLWILADLYKEIK